MPLSRCPLWKACLPLVLSALVVGCHRPAEEGAAAQTAPGASDDSSPGVIHPQRAVVRRRIEQPGYNIEPFQRTPVYAKIPGYVACVKVDIGDPVQPGQLLAELSVPEMQAELRQKEAAVRQAVAEIEQAQAAVRRAEAEQRRAQSQYERLARLGGSGGVIDRENVEETRFALEAAGAAVEKARADVGVARARQDAARQDVGHVQALLGYTHLEAPFKGVISRRGVDVGHFVQPAAGMRGEPLFVVDDIDRVRVFVDVPAADAIWVHSGQPAEVRVPGLAGEAFRGRVTRDARSLQPSNRTLRTEIDLPNPEHRLLPGMFAYVTITAEHPDVWALPRSAVKTGTDDAFAYLVTGDHARRTPLRVGLAGDDQVEIRQVQTGSAWRSLQNQDQFLTVFPSGDPAEVRLAPR